MTPPTTNHAEIPTPETDELLEGREHGNAIEFLARSLEKRLHQATAQLDATQTLLNAALASPCPHIVSSREGTNYCDLAESSVSRLTAQLAALEECNRGLRADLQMIADSLMYPLHPMLGTFEVHVGEAEARRIKDRLAQTPASVSDDLAAKKADDTARLDWLTKFAEQPIHCCWLQFHNAEDMGYSKADRPVSITVKPFGGSPDISAKGENLRAAIDAARTQEKHP